MNVTQLFAEQLEREAVITRRQLERVPSGLTQWKPHPKSMPFGYLATLCATMPGWIELMVNQPSLDLNPPGGNAERPKSLETADELVAALDASVAKSLAALRGTNDEHLMTKWQLLVGGHVVQETTRYESIGEGVLHHLAHHRGQLTVYLRLNDVAVPSIYGPTADEGWGA